MGGGSPTNTTQTTKTELPSYVNWHAPKALNLAGQLAATPFQPYTGQTVAPLNNLQQQVAQQAQQGTGWQPMIQGAQNALNQGIATTQQAANAPAAQAQAASAGAAPLISATNAGRAPLAQSAGDVQAGSFPGANLQSYMNPYTQQVLDNSLNAIDRTRQQQQVQNASAATAAGAFGGSRHGVVEALTNEAALRQSGDVASQLNQANFNQAQQAIMSDQNRALQAGMFNAGNDQQTNLANQAAQLNMGQFNAGLLNQANLANQQSRLSTNQFNAGNQQQTNLFNAQMLEAMRGRQMQGAGQIGDLGASLGQLGAFQGNLAGADMSRLLGIGNQLQDDQQFGLDRQYQEFLRSQQDPYDRLNAYVGAISGSPSAPTTTAQQPLYRNRTAGALGGAATGASAGSAFGPWGALIGGVVGAGAGYFGS